MKVVMNTGRAGACEHAGRDRLDAFRMRSGGAGQTDCPAAAAADEPRQHDQDGLRVSSVPSPSSASSPSSWLRRRPAASPALRRARAAGPTASTKRPPLRSTSHRDPEPGGGPRRAHRRGRLRRRRRHPRQPGLPHLPRQGRRLLDEVPGGLGAEGHGRRRHHPATRTTSCTSSSAAAPRRRSRRSRRRSPQLKSGDAVAARRARRQAMTVTGAPGDQGHLHDEERPQPGDRQARRRSWSTATTSGTAARSRSSTSARRRASTTSTPTG